MISDNKISDVENIIGVKFSNKKFLSQALVHKSFSNDNSSNNEILEFLGDRVLGLVLAKKLINLYPNDKEDSEDTNAIKEDRVNEILSKVPAEKIVSVRSFWSLPYSLV